MAEGGLFVEIAREARVHYPGAEIYLVCGRDAAERILTWDYGDPEFAEKMLHEFGLLVAPRSGEYVPPEQIPSCHPHSISRKLRRLLLDAFARNDPRSGRLARTGTGGDRRDGRENLPLDYSPVLASRNARSR